MPIRPPSPRANFASAAPRRLFLSSTVASLAGVLLARRAKAADGCGGYPREKFERYIGLFSENDTDVYGDYYTGDVLYERRDHVLNGRDAVLAFYREVHEHLTQKLQVVNYAATDVFIGAEVHSEFTVFKDFKHVTGGLDLKAGEHFIGHNFVHYNLRDGKIAHIKSSPFKRIG